MTEPNPPCPDCADPFLLDDDRFVCGNGQCAAAGMDRPVWQVLRDAGLAAPTAAGLPRPVHAGLPVPWVASCTATRVWWRAIDAQRLADAHNEWLCQLCGRDLPEAAWVLATPEGMVLQAALHEPCLDLALAYCPHLAGGVTRAAPYLVTRDQLAVEGRPVSAAPPSDPYFLHQWELATDRP